jgi:hypothetical protein
MLQNEVPRLDHLQKIIWKRELQTLGHLAANHQKGVSGAACAFMGMQGANNDAVPSAPAKGGATRAADRFIIFIQALDASAMGTVTHALPMCQVTPKMLQNAIVASQPCAAAPQEL